MDSEMFRTMPLTKLFFRCVIPAVVTSVFGAVYSVIGNKLQHVNN